jgi:hypothetical protein
MQRPKARLSQSLSVLGGFDAIQQHDCGIVCPDSNALRGLFRAHGEQPQMPDWCEDCIDCGFLIK